MTQVKLTEAQQRRAIRNLLDKHLVTYGNVKGQVEPAYSTATTNPRITITLQEGTSKTVQRKLVVDFVVWKHYENDVPMARVTGMSLEEKVFEK